MRAPKLRFDLAAIKGFLFRHVEKLVFAAFTVLAVALAWGGISSWRTQSVTPDRKPEEIQRRAAAADEHIGRVREVPAGRIPGHESLAVRLDQWRATLPPWMPTASLEISDPSQLAMLDKPLFQELAKRTKPDVFPLEDLRATAGIAVLPALPGAAPQPQQPGPPGEPAAGQRGRLVPYVIVTGLIPAEKQTDEYRGRFAGAGFRDAKRDAPLWTDFVVERAVVSAAEEAAAWQPVDLAAVAAGLKRDAAAPTPGRPPQRYLLGDGEQFRRTALDFCGPLPQPIDGGWDLADIHPRILAEMEKDLAAAGGNAEPAIGPGPGAPEFVQPPGDRPQEQADASRNLPAALRMFRFIDTAVEPGKTYRYRVRLKVVNPNLGLKPPAVADATLGVDPQLAAPPSQPSPAVTVPDTTRIVARCILRDDAKRMKLKPGTYEVLVLAPGKASGGYALRAFYGEAGAVANVEEKVDKAGEARARGEAVDTQWLIVDVRGRQEDRGDSLQAKSREPIPEPVEVLGLRPDGRFELVSAADGERLVARYLATLPALDGGRRDERKAQPGEAAEEPALIPFSFPEPAAKP